MSRDYYADLGVSSTATAAEIKAAWRRAAKDHPDRRPDDKAAHARFSAASAAWAVLSDPTKRAAYDEFGDEGLKVGFDLEANRAARRQAEWTAPGVNDVREAFAAQQRASDRRRRRNESMEPKRVPLTLAFIQAIDGGVRTVNVDGEDIRVVFEPGVQTGDSVTVQRQGLQPIVFTVHVQPDATWSRDGMDIHMRADVHLWEAFEGSAIDIVTPHGPLTVRLSRVDGGVANGKKLTLPGLGVRPRGQPPGDLVLTFNVVMPRSDRSDPTVVALLKRIAPPTILRGRH